MRIRAVLPALALLLGGGLATSGASARPVSDVGVAAASNAATGRLDVRMVDATSGDPVGGFARLYDPATGERVAQADVDAHGVAHFVGQRVGRVWVWSGGTTDTHANEWYRDVTPGTPLTSLGLTKVAVVKNRTTTIVMVRDVGAVIHGTVRDRRGRLSKDGKAFLTSRDGRILYDTGGSTFTFAIHDGSYRLCGGRGGMILPSTCLPDPVTVKPDEVARGLVVVVPNHR